MVQIGGIVSFSNQSGGGGSSSGITSLNGQTGPEVTIKGVNGAEITTPASNCILVDVAAVSGTNKFAANFSSITSGLFTHSLGTRDILVQVQDDSGPPRKLEPDAIIFDNLDQISLLFNRPQSGRVIIIG